LRFNNITWKGISYDQATLYQEGQGRRWPTGVQTWITLREGQVIGELQLITCQRQLRKDENLCPLFRCDVNKSNVLSDVSVNVTPHRGSLSDSYRTSARHAGKHWAAH
jgi:hypothetical protein